MRQEDHEFETSLNYTWSGDVAQWLSVCLACTRPCIWSPVPQKKKKKKEKSITSVFLATSMTDKKDTLL
jgi:hypothetical protein